VFTVLYTVNTFLFYMILHMGLSIKKLSETWSVSRPTIHKKISNGELSKLFDGTIDLAEFMRVFPDAKARGVNDTGVKEKKLTPFNTLYTKQIEDLETSLRIERERRLEAEKRAERAEGQTDRLMNQLDNLTHALKLIEAPKSESIQPREPVKTNTPTEPVQTIEPQKPTKKKSLFGRFFGV
jgi:hypothetical protein